jgi:hypothetical protein
MTELIVSRDLKHPGSCPAVESRREHYMTTCAASFSKAAFQPASA